MSLTLQTYAERQLSVTAWPSAQAVPTSPAEALRPQEGQVGVIPVVGLVHAPTAGWCSPFRLINTSKSTARAPTALASPGWLYRAH